MWVGSDRWLQVTAGCRTQSATAWLFMELLVVRSQCDPKLCFIAVPSLCRTEPKAMKGSRGRTLRFLANVDPIDVVGTQLLLRGKGTRPSGAVPSHQFAAELVSKPECVNTGDTLQHACVHVGANLLVCGQLRYCRRINTRPTSRSWFLCEFQTGGTGP